MRRSSRENAPLPPSPVVTTCLGHAGIGIGAEAFRQTLLEVGANPKAPAIRRAAEQDRILERYGTTVMQFGEPLRRGDEVALVPRALLVDLDPRASNLILQSYPELFRMRDKHVVAGNGGAARNWAQGRRRFEEEIQTGNAFEAHLEALAPESARGYQLPFALGGGTGSSFACTFLQHVKENGTGNETTASIGVLPEFGYDPVIYGPACINITMNLDYQIRYADCPILLDNRRLRELADAYASELADRSSVVDDLRTSEQEIAWQEYRDMNLVAARFMSLFTASFTRETEWDFSNYRTWLSQEPKFVVPWMIPAVEETGGFFSKPDPTVDGLFEALEAGEDALLFDLDDDAIPTNGRDAALVLVKVKDAFTRDDRQTFKELIADRFPSVDPRRVIFVRIPSVEGEAASACVLVNTGAIAPRLLELVREAQQAWDDYSDEYTRAGLSAEEFQGSLVRVVNHLT